MPWGALRVQNRHWLMLPGCPVAVFWGPPTSRSLKLPTVKFPRVPDQVMGQAFCSHSKPARIV